MKRIVSIPVYTSELSAIDQCLNYLCVGEVDGIVLHVNALSSFQVERFAAVVQQLPPLRQRVWVNPQRVAIAPMVCSPHHVAFLYRAHIANFAFAHATLDFDVFCLDASNSLLLLPGLKSYIVAGRTGALGPHCWREFDWYSYTLADPIWALLGTDWWQCNPEGTFYTRRAFAAVAARVAVYEQLYAAASAPGRPPTGEFPREELLFPSLNAQLHGVDDLVPPYIFMRWQTALSWRPDEIKKILGSGQILHQHLPQYGCYGLKRVGYGPSDWLRVMVGEHYGYRTWLAQAVALWGSQAGSSGATYRPAS